MVWKGGEMERTTMTKRTKKVHLFNSYSKRYRTSSAISRDPKSWRPSNRLMLSPKKVKLSAVS